MLLKAGTPAAALHVNVLQFDEYADSVGFTEAEDTVRALSRLILDEARAASGGSAFLGHLGGSDFIVIATPALAEGLAARLGRAGHGDPGRAVRRQQRRPRPGGGGGDHRGPAASGAPAATLRQAAGPGNEGGAKAAARVPGHVVWAPPAS